MDPSPRLSPGDQLGPYEIVAPLGAGGMGEVYRALDPRLEREVALKVLPAELADHPEHLTRFEREAKALAALNHPHIVTVHSVEEAEGVRFLTMELVEGETLGELIPAGGLGLERFLDIAIPLADAVATAHSRGIVHRDLKPANVMITEEGRVKVLDFGLARREVATDAESLASVATETLEQVTREGQVVGTLPHMAPEQVQGQPATARSDIFSLGTVLYQMATGERPFDGDDVAELISSILRDEPPSVTEASPELPRQLGRIIARCLQKEPERRFESALGLRNELEELREEVVSQTQIEATAPPRPSGRPGWLTALVAAAGVVLVALAAWAILSRPTAEESAAGRGPPLLRSLVVLPATVQGPEAEPYLADAVPGTLSTKLTGIEGLETKAPPRAAELEGREMGTARLAELYGVDALVLPSVTAEGDRFVLTLQLVEAADRNLLWSEQYRGSRAEYLDLVERAALELQSQLRPERSVRPSVAGFTASSPAELAFRRGQYFSNQFNMLRRAEDLEAARSAFQEALELDPEMAEAAAEMGWLYYLQLEQGNFEALEAVESWAERALDLDPRSGLAWTDLSFAALARRQFIPSLRHALEATGGSRGAARSHNALAMRLFSAGLPELCVAAGRESVQLDPLYLIARSILGACLGALGSNQRSLEIIEESLSIEPDAVIAHVFKITALLDLGRLDEGSTALDDPGVSETDVRVRRVLRARLALLEGSATPEATGQELLRMLRESPGLYLAAWIKTSLDDLAQRGARDVVIALLEESERREGRPASYYLLSRLSRHAFLRERSEFQAMLERSRAQLDEVLGILATAEREGTLPAYLEDPLEDVFDEYGRPSGSTRSEASRGEVPDTSLPRELGEPPPGSFHLVRGTQREPTAGSNEQVNLRLIRWDSETNRSTGWRTSRVYL